MVSGVGSSRLLQTGFRFVVDFAPVSGIEIRLLGDWAFSPHEVRSLQFTGIQLQWQPSPPLGIQYSLLPDVGAHSA